MHESPTGGELPGSLRWLESGKLSSQLRAGDEVLASLSWSKPNSSLATAESVDGRWTLKRVGFLRPQVTIGNAGRTGDVAVLRMSWGGEGTLDFAGGPSFRLVHSGPLHPEWSILDSKGRKILAMNPSHGPTGFEATVDVVKGDGEGVEKSVLLTIVAWYVVLLLGRYDYASGDMTGALVATWG
jgi:hypothetical protein